MKAVRYLFVTMILGVILAFPGMALAQEGTVVVSDPECRYVLLNLEDEGMFVVMRITGGEHFPRPGDHLRVETELNARDFGRVKHSRTGTMLNTWIDFMSSSDTTVLSRYHKRC